MQVTPDISIITPTLKEAANISALVAELSSSLAAKHLVWELIVVDDDSQDGTMETCEELRQQGVPIRLIMRRRQRGLATAVLTGFKNARAPVWVVMDADLSHRGIDVVRLYGAVKKGAAFAVGSRYLPGGSTDDRWTVFRLLNSMSATLMAWPLVKVRDPMSGFFALRADLLEHGDRLSPIGYKIGLEILVKCNPQPLVEIPIHFRTRIRGKSKLSLKQQLLYIYHISKLYRYCWRRRIR